MNDRGTRRRRRRNPYAGLIHLLNRRYHDAWQRAELLQNDLNNRQNSKFARAADWLRRVFRHFVPHPGLTPLYITEKAEPYRGAAFSVPEDARVSVVIPFRDRPELLRNCLRSLRRGTFPRLEIVLVDNGSESPATGRLLARTSAKRNIRLISRPEPFNFARLCNAGASAANGDHLIFLN